MTGGAALRSAVRGAAPEHPRAAKPRAALAPNPVLGRTDDPLEREADHAASRVVEGLAAGSLTTDGPAAVRRKAAGQGPASGDASAAASAVASGGMPLPASARAYFEPRFGRDFSGVRIHTHDRAAQAAKGIGARAFTLGEDIGFAPRQFAPDNAGGSRLLAHELAHVAQGGAVVRRAPEEKPAEKSEESKAEVKFTAKDLLVYPLFVDLWNDIFAQKLTDKQKKEFKLKGTEGSAVWNLLAAMPNSVQAPDSDKSVGDFLSNWLKYAEEIHKIAGGESLYLDLFSRFIGINLESYLGSDLFISRLKTHAASLVTILAVAQVTLSTVQAVKKPSAETGDFEPSDAEKHLLLLTTLFNTVLKEQIKAPDFFALSPLKLATHPAYAGAPATAGGAGNSLVFEQRAGQGEGQGGEALKLGLTLNLPQIVGMFQKDAPPAKDVADLQKYRGWQGSLWFNYDRNIPTLMQREAGKLPATAFNTGTLFGGGGYLGLLEGGARYGGEAADQMTAWFLRGGFGYSGKKGATLQRLGFTAVYTDWKEQDIYAPRIGAGGAPVAGSAGQFSPFTKLEFGKDHKFSVGAALSFVTGTHETFGVSDFRGDFSYIYAGDTAEGELPAFKLDLSASLGRLDWWDPNSPLLTGLQARVGIRNFYSAAQVNTGAEKIPEARAAQIEKPEKMPAPTTVMISAGYRF